MTTRKTRDIEASLYDQKLDVCIGILEPAEFVRRCRAALSIGIELRENVTSFARSIDPTFPF